MRLRRVGVLFVTSLVAVTYLSSTEPVHATSPTYHLVDLGTDMIATGINSSGQVVGANNYPAGASHAFLFDGLTIRDLGTLGGATSIAYGINASGDVVGESDTGSGVSHGFLYDGTVMQDLTPLEPGRTRAAAISDSGAIVGVITADQPIDPDQQAFLRLANGDLQLLPSLGGRWSGAAGVNNVGTVVGRSTLAGGNNSTNYVRATQFTPSLVNLGTAGLGGSWAAAVNDSGVIVGTTSAPCTPTYCTFPGQEVSRPFVSTGGSMTVISVPAGVRRATSTRTETSSAAFSTPQG
jgi:probable HAF family extracellular repeat protein